MPIDLKKNKCESEHCDPKGLIFWSTVLEFKNRQIKTIKNRVVGPFPHFHFLFLPPTRQPTHASISTDRKFEAFSNGS